MEEIGPMSGGRSSREKGMRAEQQIVELFRRAGLEAYRIPLSGSVAGFKSDVELRIGAKRLHLESKVRGGRFSMIYRWLFGADALVIKAISPLRPDGTALDPPGPQVSGTHARHRQDRHTNRKLTDLPSRTDRF
jgi:hypothetical protein